MYVNDNYNPGQKSLGHPAKVRTKLKFMKNALWKSVYMAWLWSFPSLLLPQAMLIAPAMILGVKGASNQHCIGDGGGMRKYAGYFRSVTRLLARIVVLYNICSLLAGGSFFFFLLCV